MKYYVIEIAEGDAKIKGKGIYEYEDKMLALASFHSKLGTAMKSDLYASEQIMVVDSNNGIIAMDRFEKPYQPAVEVVPETVADPVTEEPAAVEE